MGQFSDGFHAGYSNGYFAGCEAIKARIRDSLGSTESLLLGASSGALLKELERREANRDAGANESRSV